VGLILVVDDDDNMRDTILDILQMEGYEAEGFSGALGVAARALKKDVSLVVTDVNMPDTDGIALLLQIKSQDASRSRPMPVIVLTGAGFESRAKEALKLGAFASFSKPFDIDEFITSIASALQGQKGGDSA